MSTESPHRIGADGVSRTRHDFVQLPTAPTLDDIHTALKNNKLLASKNVLNLFKGAFNLAGNSFPVEQFTFGQLPHKVIYEAQKDGIDFVDKELFRLPYSTCMYRASIRYDDITVGITTLNVAANKENPKERGIATVMFTHSKDYVVATHSINMLRVERRPEGNACEIQLPSEEWGYWKETMVSEGGQDIDQRDICEGSIVMLGLTMILNTKGIRKERCEPPRKPNLARARAGKLLLPYVTRVYTDVYLRAVADGPKGSHASPRPHLRRAHVRHYARDGREWYTPVEAMLVNWDGQPLQRGQYEVQT